MRIKIIFTLMIGVFFGNSACESVLFDDALADDPVTSFEYLWNECNNKYSFFEYKRVDWHEVYDRYRPLVAKDMPSDSLFAVLASMLNELKDPHVNLVSPFNVSHYDVHLTRPDNVNFRNVLLNYLGEDYQTTGPFYHNFLDDGQVGYILYSSFLNRFSDDQLDHIFNRYRNVRGLIIDLRSNGGGSPDNIYKILNRLTISKTWLFSSYLKNGPGYEQFSAAVPAYSVPSDKPGYKGTFIVLTNRSSYSAASFFALGARELDNGIIMGDTTGGALGLPNGGQLPNGWTYRFSVSRTLTPRGENFEDGIPPDILSILTPADESRGVDTVIEDALKILR